MTTETTGPPAALLHALTDPGKVTPRRPGETVPMWQARAVAATFDLSAQTAGQYVVVLGTHVPYHSSACWVLGDRDNADQFAAFVTSEIDPAHVFKARDPVAELLTWRANHLDGWKGAAPS